MTNYNLDHNMYCHPTNNDKSAPFQHQLQNQQPPPPPPPAQQQQQQPYQHHQQPEAQQHVHAAPPPVPVGNLVVDDAQQQQQQLNHNNQHHEPYADIDAARRELQHLKDMLMVHLDLIQEQNEELISRDKLVAALRKDNEMLRTRFAKMLAARQTAAAAAATEKPPHQEQPQFDDVRMKNTPTKASASTPSKSILSPIVVGRNSLGKPNMTQQQQPHLRSPNSQHQITRRSASLMSDDAHPVKCSKRTIGNRAVKPQLDVVKQSMPTDDGGASNQQRLNVEIKSEPDSVVHQTVQSDATMRAIKAEPIAERFAVETIQQTISIVPSDQPTVDLDSGRVPSTQIDIQVPTAEPPSITMGHHNMRRRRKRHDFVGVPRKRRQTETTLDVDSSALSADRLPAIAEIPPTAFEQPTSASEVVPIAAIRSEAECAPLLLRPPSVRRSFITTRQCYVTRHWVMDETAAEVDRQLDENLAGGVAPTEPTPSGSVNRKPSAGDGGQDNGPHLELPRWTIKPLDRQTSSGTADSDTEDVSLAAFQKRHARFELDEKKRKKWDIQRIREQRHVERLRARLVRDEAPETPDGPEELGTLFPLAEDIRWLQLTDDLPVQAFGDVLPAIQGAEFRLPWQEPMGDGGSRCGYGDALAGHDSMHTAIVIAKKKVLRRQQMQSQAAIAPSANAGGGSTMQNQLGVGSSHVAAGPVAIGTNMDWRVHAKRKGKGKK